MTTAYFQTLFDYNAWATDRVLVAALRLTGEEFRGPISAALGHAVGAEINLLARAQGLSPGSILSGRDFPNSQALWDRWREQQSAWRGYLTSLTDADVEAMVTYTTMRGEPQTHERSFVLAHAINHSTQHRSEAAWLLTELGHSPGDLDLILFVRERSKPQSP